MDNLKFIGIIPARYASTRFPGKPLAMMGGMTMIERVYRQALKELDEVWVATDDRRISDAVEKFGGKAVMTSVAHRSGTDRCLEAYDNIGSDADVVINIQGDEPFIDPMQIRQIKECFNQVDTQIATLVRVFEATKGYAALENPNTPKVVIGDDMRALMFSRSVIPYVRGVEREKWPESLEQLRWLQNGYLIRVGISDCPTIGIDTPADLEAALELLNNHADYDGEN